MKLEQWRIRGPEQNLMTSGSQLAFVPATSAAPMTQFLDRTGKSLFTPPVTFPADLGQSQTMINTRLAQVCYAARSSPDSLNDNCICGFGRTFHLGLGREGYLL